MGTRNDEQTMDIAHILRACRCLCMTADDQAYPSPFFQKKKNIPGNAPMTRRTDSTDLFFPNDSGLEGVHGVEHKQSNFFDTQQVMA